MLPITPANVQSFCRICLRELIVNPNKPSHDVDTENLYKLLENITGVSTNSNKISLYPSKVCDSCYIKMIALDSFREKSIKMALLENLKESSIVRLKTYCRICLKHTDDKVNIDENMELLGYMEQYCGIQQIDNSDERSAILVVNERFPRTLCCKCSSKLKTFKTFRSMAVQSAEYLGNLIGDGIEFKSKNEADELGTLEKVGEQCRPENTLISKVDIETNEFVNKPFNIEYCDVGVNVADFIDCDEPLMPNFEVNKLETNPLVDTFHNEENVPNVSDTNTINYTVENCSVKNAEASSSTVDRSLDVDFGKPKKARTKKFPSQRLTKGLNRHLKCPNCDRTFYKQVMLDGHIKSEHEGLQRPFACELCPSSFRHYSALDRHRILLHTPKEPMPTEVDVFAQPKANIHVCMTCLRQFKRKDVLEQHINTAHTDTELRPFKCKFCHKGFGSKRTMLRHEKNHSVERPFACEFCPKRYNTKADYTSHMQRHTTNPELLCPICKRGKSNAEELQKHIAMHEASRQHQCSTCGRVFKKLFHLREHENAVHLKLRPFKCSHCEKTFATRRTQKEHELLHDPTTRPVLCILCTMNFKNESTLSRHMTKEHNQLPKKSRTKNS